MPVVGRRRYSSSLHLWESTRSHNRGSTAVEHRYSRAKNLDGGTDAYMRISQRRTSRSATDFLSFRSGFQRGFLSSERSQTLSRGISLQRISSPSRDILSGFSGRKVSLNKGSLSGGLLLLTARFCSLSGADLSATNFSGSSLGDSETIFVAVSQLFSLRAGADFSGGGF